MTLPTHLFVTSQDGALFDCRVADWHRKAPLRAVFSRHYRTIETVAEFKACLRAGKSTDLGGYPLFFLCHDGESLSFEAARENVKTIMDSIANRHSDGWRVVGCDVNYEDSEMVCAHTGKRIPSAYGDDDDATAPA